MKPPCPSRHPPLGAVDAGPPAALSVRFWGVRGSFPAPGPGTVEFGGNTPCVEVRVNGRPFVLDAGTGIVGLGAALAAEGVRDLDVLLSHLHLDHIGGLPFFPPALMKGATIRLRCGNLGGASPEEPLSRIFAPPLFPVGLRELPARFEYAGFRAGEDVALDGARVRTCALHHPAGSTGYRFDSGGRAVVYVSDIEHEGAPAPEVVDFARGADLVIYDAMYTPDEYVRCKGWGHSTWQAGVALCEAAGAARLAAFHHHPLHDDARVRGLEAQLAAAFPGSFYAREGQVLAYAARAPGAAPAAGALARGIGG